MRKVAVLSGDGSIKVIEAKTPELDCGMVQIRVSRSLVSPGTELKGWSSLASEKTNPNKIDQPKTFGYSISGVVEAVGKGVSRFSIGNRVVGIGAGYALHSDVVVVPQNLCAHLPAEVDFGSGSYTMLLATALQVVRRAKPELGEKYLISGLGIVGLLSGKMLELSGCKVVGIDKHPLRVQIAKSFGFDDAFADDDPIINDKLKRYTHNEGFDGAVLAFGGPADEAIELISKNMRMSPDGHRSGSIITVGWPIFSYTNEIGGMNNIDIKRSSRTGPGYHDDQWERSDQDYPHVFVRWTTRKNIELCLDLLKTKKIDVQLLTTHVVEFEKLEESIAILLEDYKKMLGVEFSY